MKGMLALCFALCATPLFAEQGRLPALYDVRNVTGDDVLNIRRAPNSSSPIIGTLASSAKDIEVIRKNDTGKWALINAGEQRGFVSLSYLSRQQGQSNEGFPNITRCFGTEPFWSLAHTPMAEGSNATWSTPGTTRSVALVKGPQSANRSDQFGISGKAVDDQDAQFAGILSLDNCNDGMSDRAFGLSLSLIWNLGQNNTAVYSGCCSIAP